MENTPAITETALQKSLGVIKALKAKVDAIGNQCKLIKIKDDSTLAIAQQNLSKANEMAKFIEDTRVTIKAPYLAAGKQVDDLSKDVSKQLNEGVTHLKTEVKAYELKKQSDAKAKQDAIDTELAAQKAALESQPLDEETIDKFNQIQVSAQEAKQNLSIDLATNKTRGIRYNWKFEVVDINQVPKEWLTVNETAVKDYMKENKDDLKEETVNGIRYYKDMIVTA